MAFQEQETVNIDAQNHARDLCCMIDPMVENVNKHECFNKNCKYLHIKGTK